MTINQHHRRATTGGETFFLNHQRYTLIRRGFSQANAQFAFYMTDDIFSTIEPAGDIGTETLCLPTGLVSSME